MLTSSRSNITARNLPTPAAPDARSVRRIAIVRALQLGDLLVAVPALRALRAHFSHAEMTLVGLPWAASFTARFAHYLDRFIAFPGWPGIDEAPYSMSTVARFLAEQRAYHYDLILQMHGNGAASNGFALALGGEMTAGYVPDAQPTALTFAAPYPAGQPEALRTLGLARLVGCPTQGLRLEFPLMAADHAEAGRLLAPVAGVSAPLIGIHAGARASARRWPPRLFAIVADTLAQRYGARILLTGGPDEAEIVAAVARAMRTPALNLAGKTSLGGLAALLARLDLFISNDSGPAHIAEAVDAPSVTIFGPADPRRWAPLDTARHPIVRAQVACSPCGYVDCPIDHRCLRQVRPEMVLAAADQTLAKGDSA